MFDLADTRTILLLGEPGAGKSSLVHALCTDGPQISRDPRGETCRFAAFSSHLGCFIDSPGPPGIFVGTSESFVQLALDRAERHRTGV